jgi:hypothetical protein
MQCRTCGTEIASKAIVCYRCGAATTDPVRRAVPIRQARGPRASFVAAAVLLLAALYTGYASQTVAEPDQWRTLAGVLAGAAALVLALGAIRSRRR